MRTPRDGHLQHRCQRDLMASDETLLHLAEAFSSLEPHVLQSAPAEDVLNAITSSGLRAVRGAEHSAITRGRPGAFKTVGQTSDVPLRVDSIQYELGYGPCVDAIVDNTTYVCPDLAEEQRWAG